MSMSTERGTKVVIRVDGKEINAFEGEPVLWAALRAGIYIPNLCAVEGKPLLRGSCLLCWIGVEGQSEPALACGLPARQDLDVRTDDPAALRLRHEAFDLMMAAHQHTCRGCTARATCQLLEVARHHEWRVRATSRAATERFGEPDLRHTMIAIDPGRCILCGRCLDTCSKATEGRPYLAFIRRGKATRISTFLDDGLPTSCSECLACVEVCPAGGLTLQKNISVKNDAASTEPDSFGRAGKEER